MFKNIFLNLVVSLKLIKNACLNFFLKINVANTSIPITNNANKKIIVTGASSGIFKVEEGYIEGVISRNKFRVYETPCVWDSPIAWRFFMSESPRILLILYLAMWSTHI